jgi:hypothetical protein
MTRQTSRIALFSPAPKKTVRGAISRQVQIAGHALVYGFARMNIDGHSPCRGVNHAEAERTAEGILDLFIEEILVRGIPQASGGSTTLSVTGRGRGPSDDGV